MNFIQQRTPELCFFRVRIPCVNVLLHHSAEIWQLREIKALLNGCFKRLPRTGEAAVKLLPGMTTDGRNTEPGNELCQRAAAAFLNGGLQPLKGFFTEAIGLNDSVAVLLQLIQIRKRMNLSMPYQLFQRRL